MSNLTNLLNEPEVWTIGYSGRTLAELQAALAHHEIDLLVDIRRTPQSRAFPEFNRPRLAEALGERYVWVGALGNSKQHQGLAGWTPIDVDAAWAAIRQLQQHVASGKRLAIMCHERAAKGCHRAAVAPRITECVTHIR